MKTKICKYCGHPINEKPESRLVKQKRVSAELKKFIDRNVPKEKKEVQNGRKNIL